MLVERPNKPAVLTRGHAPSLVTNIASPRSANLSNFNYEFMPGIRGLSRDWAELAHLITETLSEELPPSETHMGAYEGLGITGSWTKFLTVCAPQNPSGHVAYQAGTTQRERIEAWQQLHPTKDRARYLSQGFSPSEVELLRFLCRRYFRDAVPTPFKLHAVSNLGAPSFTSNPEVRAAIVAMWMAEHEGIMTAFAKGDLDSLYLVYNLLLAYWSKNRRQNDAWVEVDKGTPDAIRVAGKWYLPKVRSVFDFKLGDVQAKKAFWVDDLLMSLKRTRPVAAGPTAVSLPVIVLAHVVGANMDQDSCYKSRGAADLERRLEDDAPKDRDGNTYRIRGDVSQSDSNQPIAALNIVCDELERAFGLVGSMARALFAAPALCPDSQGEGVAYWTSNPRTTGGFTNMYVIPSGHPMTSAVTTILNCWHLLCGLVREKGYSYEAVDALLKGTHPDMVLFVGGDNMAISSRISLPPMEKLITPVPTEGTDRIMGLIPVRDSYGKVRYVPDIRGMSDKYPSEYPWDSPIRKFPAFGEKMQREIYSKAPAGAHFFEILDWCFKKKMGQTVQEIWAPHFVDPLLAEGFSSLTTEEMIYALKPEARFYMDLDFAKVDRVMGTVPVLLDQEALHRLVSGYYNHEPVNWLPTLVA